MEFIRENIIWVILAVTSGGMLLFSFRGGGKRVTPPEVVMMLNREEGIVLDIRETSEWSAGHIANAHHISNAQLANRLSELNKYKEKPVIVCCATGLRAPDACKTLSKNGFKRAYILGSGIRDWTDAGLPLSKK